LTYGWALVMVATLIGALVMVGTGQINTRTCTSFASLICKGVGAEGDTLILILQNANSQKITINPLTGIYIDSMNGFAVIEYQGTEYEVEDVTIGQGEDFTIRGEGMVAAEEITITYYEHGTGFTKTVSSSVGTGTESVALGEICNNGIDDDGDLAADCIDQDCDTCTYILTNPVIANFDGGVPDSNPGILTREEDGTPTDSEGYLFYINQHPAMSNAGYDGTTEITSLEYFFYLSEAQGKEMDADLEVASEINFTAQDGWNIIKYNNFHSRTSTRIGDYDNDSKIQLSNHSNSTIYVNITDKSPILKMVLCGIWNRRC